MNPVGSEKHEFLGILLQRGRELLSKAEGIVGQMNEGPDQRYRRKRSLVLASVGTLLATSPICI